MCSRNRFTKEERLFLNHWVRIDGKTSRGYILQRGMRVSKRELFEDIISYTRFQIEKGFHEDCLTWNSGILRSF
jgi:hypothetical protein